MSDYKNSYTLVIN